MGLKSSNKVDVNRYELEIEVSAEDFLNEVEKVYKKQKNKINVPGFRRGKAPRKFIEKYYGQEVFYEDALNGVYPKALEDAAKEANLELVNDHIDFELVKMNKEEGVDFKVKVTVMPEVTVEGYKEIQVEKKSSPKVTAKDIDARIKLVQEQNARLVSSEDGTIEEGDVVNIDFKGTLDSVAFDGGTAEGVELEIGKHQFIEDFEKGLLGHKSGEHFEMDVTFPEDYHVPTLAGKKTVFETTINSVQKKELPTVDDEFVKDVSEFETLDDYKKDLKEKILKEKKHNLEHQTEHEIKEKFLNLVKADIPEALIKEKSETFIRDFEYRLRSQGLGLKDYMKYTGADMDKMLENFKPQATEEVKMNLGLKAVGKAENLDATEEELNKEFESIAKSCACSVDQVKKFVSTETVKSDIICRKAWDLIKSSAIKK